MRRPKLLTLAALAALIAVPSGVAHTAPPPRDHEDRLLHDCNDDYYGGDVGGNRPGHDIHALDVREAWNAELGDHLVFRVILIGDSPGPVKLDLKAAGTAKSYEFKRTSGTWGGTFAKITHIADIGDGDRFALEGSVKRSSLGVDVGDKLREYKVTRFHNGEQRDRMPGYDGVIGICDDGETAARYERPDYTIRGPTKYVKTELETPSTSVKVGQEKFVAYTITNKLRDSAQTATLTMDADDGAEIRFHDPDSGKYKSSLSMDLNKKGSSGDGRFIHIAITGKDDGASGDIELVVTTGKGGRMTDTLAFTVTAGDATPTPPGEDSPLPVTLLLAALVLAARRR